MALPEDSSGTAAAVHIAAGDVRLEGDLILPFQARGIVLFVHGSGSSRHSPRNAYVARVLREAGLGTLLFDLLTVAEDRDYATRFDIPLLTSRLLSATRFVAHEPVTAKLAIGYFGASTGAAAALVAAAEVGPAIGAVVSRGGRPDLAGVAVLTRVIAPTLLLVGGEDHEVLALNREAYARLACAKALHIVPGATHLFEEPGALEEVAAVASDWFRHRLVAAPGAAR